MANITEDMVLIDYFACHAGEEDLLSVKHEVPYIPSRNGYVPDSNWRAKARYIFAKKMLKERENG